MYRESGFGTTRCVLLQCRRSVSPDVLVETIASSRTVALDALHQLALYVEALYHNLDHPVGIGDAIKVLVEVAQANPLLDRV